MKAQAPGKLVLSGAYSILWEAPAVVTAVDRHVWADGQRVPDFQAPEVVETLELLRKRTGEASTPPWFDASRLREGDRKLGLGSSAAICVASLWVRLLEHPFAAELSPTEQRQLTFELALEGHRRAQGGGSGIDVAAAAFGGTLQATWQSGQLELEARHLPSSLYVEAWAMTEPASTAQFVARVRTAESERPHEFSKIMSQQKQASERAAQAVAASESGTLVEALRAQHDSLRRLGELANVPIVLPVVQQLHAELPSDACFLPSGAGGGDITLYFGKTPSPPAFRSRARRHSLVPISLGLSAAGVTTMD